MPLVAGLGTMKREAAVAYLKRGGGQIIAKLVYAVYFGLAVLQIQIVQSVPMDFVATWILQAAMWWGLFLERNELVGFLSMDQRAPVRSGQTGVFHSRAAHHPRCR